MKYSDTDTCSQVEEHQNIGYCIGIYNYKFALAMNQQIMTIGWRGDFKEVEKLNELLNLLFEYNE